jgi:hypothetical protein
MQLRKFYRVPIFFRIQDGAANRMAIHRAHHVRLADDLIPIALVVEC